MRQISLKVLVLVLFFFCFYSEVYSEEYVTGNIITNPSFTSGTSGWETTGEGSSDYHPTVGGSQYSFGYTGTLAQRIAINNALSGTGIRVTGLRYGWTYAIYCNNTTFGTVSECSAGQGPSDTLSAEVKLTSTSGQVIYSQDYLFTERIWAWQSHQTDVNFSTTYAIETLDEFSIKFTGVDGGGTVGGEYPLGPSVRNIDARLKYGYFSEPELVSPIVSYIEEPIVPGETGVVVEPTTTTVATQQTRETQGQSVIEREQTRVSERVPGQILSRVISNAISSGMSTDSGLDESGNSQSAKSNSNNDGVIEEDNVIDGIPTANLASDYTIALPDRADFYQAREVYRRTFVPDSRRGLRMGLASELKFNEMVDQQYNR